MSDQDSAPWKDESLLEQKYCVEGLTIQEIADGWDTTFDTVRYYMRKYNVERWPGGANPDAPYKDEDKLRKMYSEMGMSLNQIASEFETGGTVILDWMKRFGIERRTADQDRFDIESDVLEQLYWEEDMTLEEIGDEFGMSHSAVQSHMKKHDIGRRAIPEEMPPNHRITLQGYEEARTKIDQKEYSVPIHRLIAVAHDKLTPEEFLHGEKHVHHKNNIPWDNRPKNLEVMTKSEHHSIHYSDRETDSKGKLI